MEFEPDGKAAGDIRHIYEWTFMKLDMMTATSKDPPPRLWSIKGKPKHEPEAVLRKPA
jgi:hypothetical protein